jgi:hypothetical protein
LTLTLTSQTLTLTKNSNMTFLLVEITKRCARLGRTRMSKKYAKCFTLGTRTNGLGFVAAAKPDCNCNWCYKELDNELLIYLSAVRLSEDSVGP